MKRKELVDNIFRKGSFLCVGLDPDIRKIPQSITGTDPERIVKFNKAIIDATAEFCVAYKPNLAFYECHGIEGWKAFEETVRYIREKYPDQFIIADAKRGDIGNTAARYAAAFFDNIKCDAVTLAPYMGEDSVRPFLEHENHWSIVLALTSNPSADDFELVQDIKGVPLYQRVIRMSRHWGSPVNMMYVVGATRPEALQEIRALVPRHFLLVPGVGAQGGNFDDVVRYGLIDECGLLVNSSRGIIHASADDDFATAAAEAAKALADKMQKALKEVNIG